MSLCDAERTAAENGARPTDEKRSYYVAYVTHYCHSNKKYIYRRRLDGKKSEQILTMPTLINSNHIHNIFLTYYTYSKCELVEFRCLSDNGIWPLYENEFLVFKLCVWNPLWTRQWLYTLWAIKIILFIPSITAKCWRKWTLFCKIIEQTSWIHMMFTCVKFYTAPCRGSNVN